MVSLTIQRRGGHSDRRPTDRRDDHRPPDAAMCTRAGGESVRDGLVRVPSEAALITWVAHRCHRTLESLFGKLHMVSAGVVSIATMWHIVGSVVVTAATQLPQLAGSDEL